MTRTDLLTTEEGVNFMIDKWTAYLDLGNGALEQVNKLNSELRSYFCDHIPLSSNSIARKGGFRRINNTLGIYTNDLHRHIKQLDSGIPPAYSPTYIPELRKIDKEAQEWKKSYNKAVNEYKVSQDMYFLSLHNSDGTFEITKWL